MTAELAGAGELPLYSRDDYHGRSQTVRDASADLRERSGYREVCGDVDFRGRCRMFEPGEYASLERLSKRISSVREVR
jgi:hypothetical protein